MADPQLEEETTTALARVRLLVLDVDGTLTDGRIQYAGEREIQVFDVKDGQGLAWLAKAGIRVAWITGRGCEATRKRARDLGVEELHLLVGDKRERLAEIQTRLGLEPEATLAMGDDVPDLAMAPLASLFACPSDAVAVVREAADLVTRAPGGRGAVREVCDAILAARGDAGPGGSAP